MNLDIEKLKECTVYTSNIKETLTAMLFFIHYIPNAKIHEMYFEEIQSKGELNLDPVDNYPYVGYCHVSDTVSRFNKNYKRNCFTSLQELVNFCKVKPIVEKIYNNDFKLKINLENRTFSIGGCSYPMEILNNLNELNKEAEKLL